MTHIETVAFNWCHLCLLTHIETVTLNWCHLCLPSPCRMPEFPTHPCLRLVSCSLQPLQRHVGRRLVTMEKCLGWEEHLKQEGACAGNDLAREQERLKSHDNFREKYFSDEYA